MGILRCRKLWWNGSRWDGVPFETDMNLVKSITRNNFLDDMFTVRLSNGDAIQTDSDMEIVNGPRDM